MYHLGVQDNLQWAEFFKHNIIPITQCREPRSCGSFSTVEITQARHHMDSVIHYHTVLLVGADCMGQAEGKCFHSDQLQKGKASWV